MEEAAIIFVGIFVWHLAALSSLALYSGVYTEAHFIAPKRVFFSPHHKLGLFAATSAGVIFATTASTGVLQYGIFAAGALMLLDTFLIYRSVTVGRSRVRKDKDS